MARLGKFPFEPNMADCKMIVQADGAVCYIMDTYCRDFTEADKAVVDRKIMQIAMASALRKQAKGSA